MKNIEKGKPLNNKKPLELGELAGETAKITITVSKELHKKIKQKALDDDRGVLELVLEVVERAFSK
jgi:hypothetical protein